MGDKRTLAAGTNEGNLRLRRVSHSDVTLTQATADALGMCDGSTRLTQSWTTHRRVRTCNLRVRPMTRSAQTTSDKARRVSALAGAASERYYLPCEKGAIAARQASRRSWRSVGP